MLTQEVVIMGRPRRVFTREFKQEAVKLGTAGGHPTAQVARDLGDHAESVTALEAGRRRSGRRLPRQGTAQAPRRGARPAKAGFLKKYGGVLRQAVGMRCQAI